MSSPSKQPAELLAEGMALFQRRQFEEALRIIGESLAADPAQPLALNNQGVALQQLDRHAEALASFDRAIGIGGNIPDIHFNRGLSLQALHRINEALAAYDKALALRPGYPAALNNRGNVLREMERYDDALASFDRAIGLQPDYAEAWNNRGNALRRMRRNEDAIASYDKATELKPDFARAWYHRGIALQELRRHDEALESYDRAIAIQPDFADAQWSKGFVKLLTGDFAGGWPLYEWRWKMSDFLAPRRAFRQPQWTGMQDINGKTVLLHAEQGFGDTIHFCRYARRIFLLGAKIVLEVQPALKSLMQSLEGPAQVIAHGEALPDFDYHCPLLSLPLACGTRPDNIPAAIPYLRAPDERREFWTQKLGPKRKRRVGLVWSGNPKQKNDFNRSMSLFDIMPFASCDVELYSLQKDLGIADRIMLAGTPKIGIPELGDFADTAALMEHMDIVITVCTSAAHLAGALGRPVWILLSHTACWRWMLDRSDSPWYPTARLFRQTVPGEWGDVVEAVKKELT
ncbi:MAG: tetratricopeptide repeat protein [Bdellovibrionales bacterium]